MHKNTLLYTQYIKKSTHYTVIDIVHELQNALNTVNTMCELCTTGSDACVKTLY